MLCNVHKLGNVRTRIQICTVYLQSLSPWPHIQSYTPRALGRVGHIISKEVAAVVEASYIEFSSAIPGETACSTRFLLRVHLGDGQGKHL